MLTIYRSEASASLRRVPLWLVTSDGTSPATAEAAGQPQICWHPRGTATENTSGTLSLVSANAGLYHVELNASQVSALGLFSVHYRSATAIAQTVFGKIVNFDSGDSMRFGQLALPNAAANASGGLPQKGTLHSDFTVRPDAINYSALTTRCGFIAPGTMSGVTIQGLSNYANISNVTLAAGTHSGATVQGVTRVNSNVTPADALYSGVTVRLDTVAYSGATLGVNNIAAGSYSGVTLQGVTRLNSNVTLNADTHSGATIQGVTRVNSSVTPANALYSEVTVRLDPVDYSGATVGINNASGNVASRFTVAIGALNYSDVTVHVTGIVPASFNAGAIDAAALSTDAGQEIADRILLRNIDTGSDSGRSVAQAFAALRNRTAVSGSTGTVYLTDDTTSSWTFSVTTVASTGDISDINPSG